MITDVSLTILLAVSGAYLVYGSMTLLYSWFFKKKSQLTETFDTERLLESVQNQLSTWRDHSHPRIPDTESSTGSITPIEASMHNESDHGSDATPALVKR